MENVYDQHHKFSKCCLNINWISSFLQYKNKTDSIRLFPIRFENKLDVLCFTRFWLTPKDSPPQSVRFVHSGTVLTCIMGSEISMEVRGTPDENIINDLYHTSYRMPFIVCANCNSCSCLSISHRFKFFTSVKKLLRELQFHAKSIPYHEQCKCWHVQQRWAAEGFSTPIRLTLASSYQPQCYMAQFQYNTCFMKRHTIIKWAQIYLTNFIVHWKPQTKASLM